MAEYKSFGFLMHDQPTRAQPIYIKDAPETPATFQELYPSRECQEIRKEEKHYWRTGHRILFTMVEDRTNACVIIKAQDTEANKEMRPLVVDAELLYPIIDADKTRKEGSGLEDTKLLRAVSDYLLARLKVAAEPRNLPDFWDPECEELQLQVFLDKSFSDSWDTLERPPPGGQDYGSSWITEFRARRSAEQAPAEGQGAVIAEPASAARSSGTGVAQAAQEDASKATPVTKELEAPANSAHDAEQVNAKVGDSQGLSKSPAPAAPTRESAEPLKSSSRAAGGGSKGAQQQKQKQKLGPGTAESGRESSKAKFPATAASSASMASSSSATSTTGPKSKKMAKQAQSASSSKSTKARKKGGMSPSLSSSSAKVAPS